MSQENSSAKNSPWVSRRNFITALLAQTLGINTFVFLPHDAVSWGAAGHTITFALIYISIGIPILYMENVVGQFTGRDCLEVWRARACLSHFGYVHLFWQILYVIYIHTLNSFIVHYFLISFESPIPYYICGRWSTPDCDILNHNYTVNQDCLKLKEPSPYCQPLCHSYPEYQYWRYNILGIDKDYYYLPWRVGLASGLISVFMFLGCFKGIKSLKRAFFIITVLPVCGRFLFMIGSMLQKGLVVKYEEAFDSDFSVFSKQFSLSNSIAEVLYTLNVGTGLAFSCSSRTSFRAPCYSNTVIIVIVTCCVTILGICSTAMMTCPYAFKYDIKPVIIMNYPMANIFEKIPRFIHVYESTSFWLVLSYGFIAMASVGLSMCINSSLLEMLAKRNDKVAKNPGLTAFATSIALYIGTAPLVSNACFFLLIDIKRTFAAIMIFMVILENLVFVLWYGLEKFSEDVHFMQGVQPNVAVKACWLVSSVILIYVFGTQMYKIYFNRNKTLGSLVGWWLLVINVVLLVLVTTVKLLIALFKKKWYDQVCLDPTWGPKSDILKRSRAMFTAQAMTKEYMYRQYHLQAGILMRQKKSNIRKCYNLGWNQRAERFEF